VDRGERNVEQTRTSLALRHFFESMRDCQDLEILDLGEFNEHNREFVDAMGHHLVHEDLVARIDETFGPGDPAAAQRQPGLIDLFLNQNLQGLESQFDAVFVWDTLQYASRPLLEAIVNRLHALMRPRAAVFACFQCDILQAGPLVTSYSFRLVSEDTLELYPRGLRRHAQIFTNRGIEKAFETFSTIKFYLTRDSLREVVARR
jgi:hypothetical protein